MTESKKAFAIAAGLAGVAGAATLVAAPNTVSASTGTVTYSEGATTVWQTPAFNTVQRYVVKDQSIAIVGQKTVNGTIWYQIGTNEWIPEIYLHVDGATPQATSTANVKTAATTTATGTFQVEATYTEGAVTIWNSTNYSDASGKYLTTDATATAVSTVQANGETWYKLANGGYVPARFAAKAGSAQAVAATQPAATATQAATTTAPAAATTTPAADTTNTTTGTTAEDTANTATTAAAATSTTSAAPTTAATTTATATQAPAAAQSTATPATSATTATATQTLKVTYTDSVVTEWKSASYSQAAGKYLAPNQTVTAVGTTTANGETWYQLSDGNFVSARFFGAQGTANSSKATTTTPAPQATATTSTPAATPAKTTTPAKVATPAATTPTTSASANGTRAARIAAVINVAKAQLGKPYVWGGKGPNSFDCSGLTHYAYLNGANKEIGGYTGAQEYSGTVVSIANLQVGDLVFWGTRGATYHVAIYLGGGQYIAAPQPGENVKISSISSYFAPSFGVRVL
ncbi:C40 family peptidase [Lacticaseibacillus porcinae]|uniref:C40 family peptidase n=1 Tax=Lacticaseibacillus porcinae TaxID=1123687 RepID=UPI000F79640C|nr:C40 family peptidase [Lacticaseibacillus porcinae]